MYEEKKSLLLEMIAFQQLMVCIKKEYEFCFDCQSIEHRKGINDFISSRNQSFL
jgi:hypothetical protein